MSCCKGCKERYVGCHSSCERYKADVAEREKQKEQSKAAKMAYMLGNSYDVNRVETINKWKRRHKKNPRL